MLSKVDDATVTGVNANSYNFSWSKGATKDNDYKCTVTFSDFVTGSNAITATDISYTIDTWTYYFPTSTTWILSTEFWSFENKGIFTFTKDSLTIPANTTLTVYGNMNNWQMKNYYSNFKIKNLSFDYKGNITISKQRGINGKPRELKQIAQKANITIFGFHIDNTRITQDVE